MESLSSKIPISPEDYTILLASSNENILVPAAKSLRDAGFHVTTCRNGLEVLSHYFLSPPTMLILEEQLEELDGISVIHRLYAIPRFRRSPFMFLTRKAGEWPMWATTRDIYGAVCFLTIPFSPVEFLQILTRCIKGIRDGEFPRTEQDFPFPEGFPLNESDA